MKGLTKVFGQDMPGSKDFTHYSNFEDSAPSWEELSKAVAAERQRLNVPVPDLEAVSMAPRSVDKLEDSNAVDLSDSACTPFWNTVSCSISS